MLADLQGDFHPSNQELRLPELGLNLAFSPQAKHDALGKERDGLQSALDGANAANKGLQSDLDAAKSRWGVGCPHVLISGMGCCWQMLACMVYDLGAVRRGDARDPFVCPPSLNGLLRSKLPCPQR